VKERVENSEAESFDEQTVHCRMLHRSVVALRRTGSEVADAFATTVHVNYTETEINYIETENEPLVAGRRTQS
jgi:hypothetical protein